MVAQPGNVYNVYIDDVVLRYLSAVPNWFDQLVIYRTPALAQQGADKQSA